MRREEVLRILAEKKPELHRKFGVKSIAVFGSTARNEAGPDSDIDVLVEFEHRFGLFDLSNTRFFLEDVLNEKVDLVPRNSIIPEIREIIIGEAVDVP